MHGRPGIMDIKKLKAFSVVAEFGGFSRAAGVLNVAQPVLSRQVRALEEELGVQLVYRNGRGIVLTEAGALLNEYAKGVLTTLARAESEVAALGSNPRGNVVIGMPPSMGSVLTVPLIQRFRSEHPSINMRVIEGFSGYLLEWLLTGKIDVAVLYNAPKTKSVRSEPLLREELFLIGAADDPSKLRAGPLEAKRLADLPLILPSRPHGLRLLIDQILSSANIIPNVELEVDALPATIKLAENRVGYTIHSYSLAHELIQEGRVKCWPIVNPRLTRQLILASASQRPTTAATRALTNIVRSQVRELVGQGFWRPVGPEQARGSSPKPVVEPSRPARVAEANGATVDHET
jgi:LysR family transcriptional regulator, nitrogen assimilation regulatory protein